MSNPARRADVRVGSATDGLTPISVVCVLLTGCRIDVWMRGK